MSHDAVLHHDSKVTQKGGRQALQVCPALLRIGSKVCRTEKKKGSEKKIGRLW